MDKVATRVSRQEFIRYTSKCLKELPLIITNRGTDDLYICRASEVGDRVATKEENSGKETPEVATYGCGCRKEEGKPLCKKHGRY